MDVQVVLHDAAARRWLAFREPRELIVAHQLGDVAPALRRIEAAVDQGSYAAGFLSYEAAPAFDTALPTHPLADFPLLWFGLYREPDVIRLPALPAPTERPAPLSNWIPSVARPDYDRAIHRIKDHIARGDTYQVNYTLRLRTPFAGEAWALFLELAEAQRADYAAYVDAGRFAICSASPELFFHLDGRHLEARPMKGTAARGRTLREDEAQAEWLHHSEKNRAENVMIVDMIRNDFGRVAEIGSIQVPAPFAVERYPTVWQMTSTVTATTRASVAEIMAALFPCASITGAPKPRTMRLIRELEPTPRRIYTGAIGFLAPGGLARRRAQFNVAIRTVLVDRATGQAEYGVGGGIVWDSVADDEYAECQIKARVLTARPPTFALLESLRWTPEAGYFLLERHLGRLRDSAAYFSFALDIGRAREQLAALAGGLPAIAHKVRLLVAQDGDLQVEAAPLPEPEPAPGPLGLHLALTPLSPADVFLYHKTTQRQIYDRARAARPGADDVLLWNERGEITETTVGNVAVQLDGEWFTPPVECGLLAGTYRALLLDEGRIRERTITREMLSRSQGLAVVNSVRLWRAARLSSIEW